MPTMPQPPVRPFIKPYLAMTIWGDTMYGVHITIAWRKGTIPNTDTWTFTTPEMLRRLRGKLERYLR